MAIKNCDQCGKTFEGHGRKLRCSPQCAQDAQRGKRNFKTLHHIPEFHEVLGMELYPDFLIRSDGYIEVKVPAGFPMRNSQGRCHGHRLVMAHCLGRPLDSSEHVHHRNGVRHDNRLENLELWTRVLPAGIRVDDLLDFVIRYYRPELEGKLGHNATCM